MFEGVRPGLKRNSCRLKDWFLDDCFRNMIYMAEQEMRMVDVLQEEIIERVGDRLLFYYGADDAWAPVDYARRPRQLLGDKRVIICDSQCSHAFVLTHSRTVAQKLLHWISDS